MKRSITCLMLCFLLAAGSFAHPGSGVVVDKTGQVYFTDTGKGVWKIDTYGKLVFMPSSRFHWLAIDEQGHFAESEKNFGGYFERVTERGVNPALIICSDFNFIIHPDGNIYYADTRSRSSSIIRRTPGGKETVLVSDKILEFVSGMTIGPDGSIYITESSNPNTNTIRKITMQGKIFVIARFTGKLPILPTGDPASYCRGLFVDNNGMIYVAATGSRSVLRITPQGKITTIIQESVPWTPTGVVLFHDKIFILEWHDVVPGLEEVRTAWIPRVQQITLDGKSTTLAIISRD